MRNFLPEKLIFLAKCLPAPLYIVGGSVRDHLAGLHSSMQDLDICAPLSAQVFADIAQENGFFVKSVYKNTGTVKLQDADKNDYEFTCFRSDTYVRGLHVPSEIFFTDNIELDCRRRDFTCNAVYYDVANACYVDPLDGITAIREKRLTTVAPAKKVFGEDGLRLLRLARQAAQLGFSPDAETLQGARDNAALIQDITPERIYTELCMLLLADQKYGTKHGHYHGIRLLDSIGVLDYILPELTLGRNMAQRADFHAYDVLEHSFRALLYAPPSVRLAALLHDVGKPTCVLNDGNSYAHPQTGAELAKNILLRLKAPKKTIEQVCTLVEWHMYDFDCRTRESKLRRFLVEYRAIFEDLCAVKQADFSACKDDLSIAPTVQKWITLLEKMQAEKVPFTLKELALNGNDLLSIGIPAPKIATVLKRLLAHTATVPQDNTKERLSRLAHHFLRD